MPGRFYPHKKTSGRARDARPLSFNLQLRYKTVCVPDYLEAAASLAHPSTNALTTAAQLSSVWSAAYVVRAEPTPFFHSSEGIVENVHATGV